MIREQLESIGFVFQQGEHCVKGDYFICIDMFPYLFETGKNKAFEFETFEELCEILDEYEKIT
jgi:hypothetical protein